MQQEYHELVLMLMGDAELARCFGSDCTTSAVQTIWNRRVVPAAKRIRETLDNGGDPKDLPLAFGLGGSNGSCLELALSILHVFLQS